MSSLGIVAGLATAVLWTVTAVCFEAASRRIGSLAVNVLRLAVAAALFIALSLCRNGQVVAPGLSASAWLDLSLSGLIGFVVGDLMLFQAFVLIGARLAMLIYASVPPMTALAGYLFLGESMSGRSLLGMGVTVAGIVIAVAGKRRSAEVSSAIVSRRRLGIVLAIGGAAGQSAGLLLGKHGSVGLDSFSATEIRVLAGLLGFLVVAVLSRRLGAIGAVLRRALLPWTEGGAREVRNARISLAVLSLGALLGPFLGVSLGLLSAQLLATGVASTLMSIVPVLLIPVSALVFKERSSLAEIIGTVVAIAGVAVLAC